MSLKWADVLDIAIELSEQKPDVDPRYVNFVDLHRWVVALPQFSDDPQRGGEKVLEAIQAAWIEELDWNRRLRPLAYAFNWNPRIIRGFNFSL